MNPIPIVTFFMGMIFTCLIVLSTGGKPAKHWQDRLIEAELAEFVVDSTTGDTTFIIYAEQSTED